MGEGKGEGKVVMKKVRIISWTLIVSVSVILTGCMSMETGGRPLKKKNIAKIDISKTTKDEIIQRFGMPSSISKPNQSGSATKMNFQGVPGFRDLFVLFSSKHKITENHRIYYYYHKYMKDSIPLLPITDFKSYLDELFILIDDSTELVVDYMYMPDKH